MGLEDVTHLSVSREWGKVLLQQPFQIITCCSFLYVLQNLQPPAWKIGMLLFTLIFAGLLDTSLAWSRGVKMVNDELGNWLLYWRIFWYLHYSSVESLCSLHLYLGDLEQLYEMREVLSWLFQWPCKEMLGMLITLSWTKSMRNSAQAMAVLQIRLERRGMLNPKQWTIILYQYKHEGTRNAVVVGMQL